MNPCSDCRHCIRWLTLCRKVETAPQDTVYGTRSFANCRHARTTCEQKQLFRPTIAAQIKTLINRITN